MAGTRPQQAITDRSGTLLYFSNFGSNTVSVVDIDNRRVLAPVTVGGQPGALKLTPDEHYLLVLDGASNDVAVVDATRRSLVTLVPVGTGPRGLAIKVFRAAGGAEDNGRR